MPIWSYQQTIQSPAETRRFLSAEECIFCRAPLLTRISRIQVPVPASEVTTTPERFDRPLEFVKDEVLRACPACGWWTASQEMHRLRHEIVEHGAVGSLCELNPPFSDAPLEDLRCYLRARYESRYSVDPWRFEHVVASVYRDLGYAVRVTGRSGDGGLDVILDGPGDALTGIQVKRYRGAIEVESIHALAGALMRAGMTHGVFVTTSRFQSGAYEAVADFAARGIAIELIDAPRFFDALGLAQREPPDWQREGFPDSLLHLGSRSGKHL